MPAASISSRPPAAQAHVLLIEDAPLVQRCQALLLENAHCRVTSASSAMEALDYLQDEIFDLILTDLDLPDLSGFETALIIRRRYPTIPTPIIAITAHTNLVRTTSCFAAGINDLCIKPLTDVHLKALLQYWVRYWLPQTTGEQA